MSLPSEIPDTQEAESGTLQAQDLPGLWHEFEATLGNSVRCCFKIKWKKKHWNSGVNVCVDPSFNPQLPSPQLLQKEKWKFKVFISVGSKILRKGNRFVFIKNPLWNN